MKGIGSSANQAGRGSRTTTKSKAGTESNQKGDEAAAGHVGYDVCR